MPALLSGRFFLHLPSQAWVGMDRHGSLKRNRQTGLSSCRDIFMVDWDLHHATPVSLPHISALDLFSWAFSYCLQADRQKDRQAWDRDRKASPFQPAMEPQPSTLPCVCLYRATSPTLPTVPSVCAGFCLPPLL